VRSLHAVGPQCKVCHEEGKSLATRAHCKEALFYRNGEDVHRCHLQLTIRYRRSEQARTLTVPRLSLTMCVKLWSTLHRFIAISDALCVIKDDVEDGHLAYQARGRQLNLQKSKDDIYVFSNSSPFVSISTCEVLAV
jgi:hypothetical protein